MIKRGPACELLIAISFLYHCYIKAHFMLIKFFSICQIVLLQTKKNYVTKRIYIQDKVIR
jgi:hypothetical protein